MSPLDLPIIQKIFDAVRSINLTGLIGIWGAILSTGLAYVKFLEFRRERLRLSTTYNLADAEHGNEIVIQNLSKTPVIISHWTLNWRKRRLFRPTVTRNVDYGFSGERREIIVPANDTRTLTFVEDSYFDWGQKTIRHGKLYLDLNIAGRAKPMMLAVYDPRH